MAKPISRSVDNRSAPFFGAEPAEMVALRTLADAVDQYLAEEVSFEDLAECLKIVRKIQKRKHEN